jgi:hypothetical protein
MLQESPADPVGSADTREIPRPAEVRRDFGMTFVFMDTLTRHPRRAFPGLC